jgi:Amt family ammonium transporter
LAVPLTNSDASIVGQLVGAGTIFVWVFVTSLILWIVLRESMGIRVSLEEEEDGVDITECGLEAYPEFVTK